MNCVCGFAEDGALVENDFFGRFPRGQCTSIPNEEVCVPDVPGRGARRCVCRMPAK